ncbi:uncharacterized protein LOC132068787 isoform X2 [Lycium ferocissimum]|uniref:uncharacterized protein LOC132068787 isoform X2 n=1 Tax=Lycium ferocissimum TaxID=112874 RepID=UPI002815986C|nr:uncharacterized protein LOC132068787 isoform X2 [Lycium ferocissimum]
MTVGYVPSNFEKYPLGGIIPAIESVFHTTSELICSGHVLEELHIWFYKNFEILNSCDKACSMAKQQNNLLKPREEKYQLRIRVFEALATGTSEKIQELKQRTQK